MHVVTMSLSGPAASIAVLLALVAFVVYASRKGEAMDRAWKARVARAHRRVATVLSSRRGSSAIRYGGQHGPEVVLRLQVDGREVTARWHVFELGLARILDGAKVAVRVDAIHPDVVYPGEEWAEISFSQRHAIAQRDL
jgi:hypothetical protein